MSYIVITDYLPEPYKSQNPINKKYDTHEQESLGGSTAASGCSGLQHTSLMAVSTAPARFGLARNLACCNSMGRNVFSLQSRVGRRIARCDMLNIFITLIHCKCLCARLLQMLVLFLPCGVRVVGTCVLLQF